jgi:hypothetical protein
MRWELKFGLWALLGAAVGPSERARAILEQRRAKQGLKVAPGEPPAAGAGGGGGKGGGGGGGKCGGAAGAARAAGAAATLRASMWAPRGGTRQYTGLTRYKHTGRGLPLAKK